MPNARVGSRRRPFVRLGLTAALVLGVLTAPATPVAAADPVDLARFAQLTASSYQDDQDGTFPAANANDGDAATRWSTQNGPDSDTEYTQWLQADLGAPGEISSVAIAWEAAFAIRYEVQTADANPTDPASWTTRATEDAGDGGTDLVTLQTPVTARYVRLNLLQRTSFDWDPGTLHWYGYSLFSWEIRGTSTTAQAVFTSPTMATPAGTPLEIPIALSAPAPSAGQIHVAATGGTAVAGTDYTAVDTDVTFAAGAGTASITLTSVDHGPLAAATTVELTLSAPTGGIELGLHPTTTVRLTPHGDLPGSGRTQAIAAFDDGTTGGLFAWGSAASSTPVFALVEAHDVPGAGADNHALQATVADMPDGGWGGFSRDIDTPADWSAFDGFSFVFLGTGNGKTLRYELKSGGATAGAATLFETSVVDDTVGWRTVRVLFSDLRVKGNPGSPVRFDPTTAHGFAVTLSDLGAGAWTFDTFALYEHVTTLEDFEGDVTINPPTNPVGFFPWGNLDDNVSLQVTAQERGDVADNHVLSGSYLIPGGGWGGFSRNFEASQDWSSFGGIRFWWYASQDNRPASPTAGDDIAVELKDDGPDGEHSELWKTSFKDNWSPDGNRWKLVELPFSSFTLRTDYTPGPEEIRDGVLSLTKAWGFALTMPPGKDAAVPFAVDQFELYGSPAAAAGATVTATPVTLVDGGATGTVDVTVRTTDGEPLVGEVTVGYTAGSASDAVAGTDFEPFDGTLTFAAGAESGSTQHISVITRASSTPSTAKTVVIALTVAGAAAPADPRVVINAHGLAYLDPAKPVAERVDDLLGRMSEAEKVGQMTQAERLGLTTQSDISTLRLGSLLSGGGSVPAENNPAGWADMIDGYQTEAMSTPLQIPLIYGVDAVHGHNNVVGATLFPHNIGLGASRDPALVQETAEVTAAEVRATGIPWTFAPCLCVTRDERWGRSYESFGEDPNLVALMARPAVTGLQGDDPTDKSGPTKVLATVKHWVGDGGTSYDPALAGSGYPIDQGITHAPDLATFRSLYIDPYLPAIKAGAGSLMPSYSAVQLGDGPVVRMHENGALNNDLLKGELGFSGFLISDWEGIDKLPSGTYQQKAARAVNAGLDMAMAPYNYAAFIQATLGNVDSGVVTQSRVDDAVRRILTQKFELGLFEQPFADRSGADTVGSTEHRAVARQAAAESQVLLKNSSGALPLSRSAKIYLAGSNADDLGRQMGGWSISWQGGAGRTTTGTTIREGLAAVAPGATITYSADASAPVGDATVGVVVVGEPPYAEGVGDVGNNGRSLDLPAADRAAIDTVCTALPTCVVLVVSGRPQLVAGQLGEIDALVASWLPGTEGAGVADVLFGATPFTGRLPVTWPARADQVPTNVGDATYQPQYPYGWGLRTDSAKKRVVAVRDHLATAKRDLTAALATLTLNLALQSKYWNADGSVRDSTAVMALLALTSALFAHTTADSQRDGDLTISVMRDVVQTQIAAAGKKGGAPKFRTVEAAMAATASLTARSDQQVAAARPDKASTLLVSAWRALGNPA